MQQMAATVATDFATATATNGCNACNIVLLHLKSAVLLVMLQLQAMAIGLW